MMHPNEYTSTFDVHGLLLSSSGAMLQLTRVLSSHMYGEPTALASMARYEFSSRDRPKSDSTGCPLRRRMLPSYAHSRRLTQS